MAMEINGIRPDYIRQYSEVNKTEKSENNTSADKIPQDEYISSEKAGNKPSGLYGLSRDENGNRKIVYDDPNKKDRDASDEVKSADEDDTSDDGSHKNNSAISGGGKPVGGKDKPEEYTGNTDAVDREIKKLKEEKKQIQQQIRSANEDEEKKKELESKLAQIESELAQKDNDTYRRQHAVVTKTVG